MKSLTKKIELLANVTIIALALLLGGVLIKRYLLTEAKPVEASAGDKISVPEVDWTKNGQTLLLVLQSDCRYCTESAEFYQRLVREAANRNRARIVAVLPQEVSDSRQYLDEHGIKVDEVRQGSLETMKIAGTPTLIMVNDKGVVTNVWRGKLTPEKESEVLSHLTVP